MDSVSVISGPANVRRRRSSALPGRMVMNFIKTILIPIRAGTDSMGHTSACCMRAALTVNLIPTIIVITVGRTAADGLFYMTGIHTFYMEIMPTDEGFMKNER